MRASLRLFRLDCRQNCRQSFPYVLVFADCILPEDVLCAVAGDLHGRRARDPSLFQTTRDTPAVVVGPIALESCHRLRLLERTQGELVPEVWAALVGEDPRLVPASKLAQ